METTFKSANVAAGLKASALALALVVAGGAANAASVTLLGNSSQGAGNTAGIDFAVGYGANTPVGAVLTDIETVPGGNPANAQSPFNSNGLTDGNSYFNVDKSASPGDITFGSAQSSFTLLWGSIDSYNTLSFDNGNSWTGTQIINAFAELGGSASNFEEVALLKFDFDPNETFTTVTFTSTKNSFEFALAPVPVPAAGLLLLGALGGLGLARRRRKAS